MQIVRTSLAAFGLLSLPSVANAERFSLETHYDTGIDTQCFEGNLGNDGQLRYGTLNAELAVPCETAPGTTPTTNAQHAVASFFLPEVAPNGYWLYDFSEMDFEAYLTDTVVGITATGAAWVSQGLEPGTNWANTPDADAGTPLVHVIGPLASGYNLAGFSSPADHQNFRLAAEEAWQQSTDGNFTIKLFAEQPKLPTVVDDGFASLESNEPGHPDAFPFTLTLDRTEVECLEHADCDDGDICNGVETTCTDNACEDVPDAPAATPCPGGECDGLGACIAISEETPLEEAVPLCAANATNQAICDAVSAFCPCAEPGGWGGAVQYYSSPGSYFWCGATAYFGAGGTWSNPLRTQMKNAFKPGSDHNDQCWVVP